jgi:hypothetical protein
MRVALISLLIYTHDLLAALFFTNSLMIYYIYKNHEEAFYKLFNFLSRTNFFVLFLILVFGGIRTYFYARGFETRPDNSFTFMLIIKHIILFILVITGLIFQGLTSKKFHEKK